MDGATDGATEGARTGRGLLRERSGCRYLASPEEACEGVRSAGAWVDATFLKVMVHWTSSPAKTEDSLKATDTRIGFVLVLVLDIAEMRELLRAREL